MARSFVSKYFGKVWIFIVVRYFCIINFISASIDWRLIKMNLVLLGYSAVFAFVLDFFTYC